MNFHIDHIELHIDDKFVELGEQLLQKQALTTLYESEKNLWIGNITDRNVFEVEIQMVAQRIKAITCDCQTFKDHQVCAHSTAVLLELRNRKKEAVEKKAVTNKKPRKSNSNLTINTILQNISKEQLEQFVKAFARQNRNFSVALKTKFAANVEVEDSQFKYLQVLKGAISVNCNSKGEFSAKNMQQILKITYQMIAQAEDMIALRNYTEGFSILEACLIRISPLLKYNPEQEENENFVFRVLQISWDLYNKEIAPTLKERIWSFYSEESFKSFYFNEGLNTHFFQFLLTITEEIDKVNQLTAYVDRQIGRTDLTIESTVSLVAFQLALYEKIGLQKEAEALIERYIDQDAVLVMAVKDAVKKQKYDRARQLADSKKSRISDVALKEKLDDLKLQIAVHQEIKSEIQQYGEIRFFQTYDFSYYQLLVDQSDPTTVYTSILEKIKRQPYSIAKRDTIAKLHYEAGNIDALLTYFETIRSLDLLKSYDGKLVKNHKKRMYHLYKELITEYLNNHLGPKPAQRVRAIIQHLKTIGAHDLVDELVSLFEKKYKNRRSLMEEIQFL